MGLLAVMALWGALAGGPPAPAIIHDCTACPRMVAAPGGTFTIGSPPDEPGRYKNEAPRPVVTIAPFAVSETEITRGQYAAFVRDTKRLTPAGCDVPGDGSDAHPVFTSINDPKASWRDPGFKQADDHPVVCVSWEDATAYAVWLSGKTGHSYRLLSESEWEYAARAGTTMAYYWGPSADRGCAHMNGGDPTLQRGFPLWAKGMARAQREGEAGARFLECEDGAVFTAPSRNYRPNAFGLYGMAGNAWEWVADCYQKGGYETLPLDGRAQAGGDCGHRRTRGGSWDDYPQDLRSARRTSALLPTDKRGDLGFRLAREP